MDDDGVHEWRPGREEDEENGREREGWTRVRGQVISFLCLLLIYSDAPRLSASSANKFLEPSRQLRTLSSFFLARAHIVTYTSPGAFLPSSFCTIHRSDEISRPPIEQPVVDVRTRTGRGLQTCRTTACVDFAIDQIVAIIARVLQRAFLILIA
jgi:hypothetical protein